MELNRFVLSWHISNHNKLDSKSNGIRGFIVTKTLHIEIPELALYGYINSCHTML